ncbi:hypothetical protein QRZ28_26335 [Raoultella ornithinolytica]|uniref:hypothetical protein n=1 Tax=Raoultella ornithinolytica TaxID=54291 RepID=UPI00255A7BAB|nr:hypothetical protein [Raoultella ornithinolytica]MDL4585368.1 hypothetical protein [Raoultella ornithinolytica]
MVWKMCNAVFHASCFGGPFALSITVSHYSLTRDAPDGESDKAFQVILAEKSRLEDLLQEGWREDMTSFFSLNGETLMALMTFCTACSIDGVQKKDEFVRKDRSPLNRLENAIQFDLREWWQPSAENLFSHMKQPHIVAALEQAGFTGAARDAAKMKKNNAAERAESYLAGTIKEEPDTGHRESETANHNNLACAA